MRDPLTDVERFDELKKRLTAAQVEVDHLEARLRAFGTQSCGPRDEDHGPWAHLKSLAISYSAAVNERQCLVCGQRVDADYSGKFRKFLSPGERATIPGWGI